MFNRRHIVSLLGLAGAAGVVGTKSAAASERVIGNTANELAEAIEAMPA